MQRVSGVEAEDRRGGIWFPQRGTVTRVPPPCRRFYRRSFALCALPALLFLVAGVATAAQSAGGLFWLALTDLGGIAVGVINAWVLLVEIKR